MANLLLDLVDPALLIDYVRNWDIEVLRPDAQFTLNSYLPDRPIDDLEFRVRRGSLNDVDAAEYRSWDTPSPMTGRPGVSRISGSLGPISRAIPLGEEETLRLRSLERGTDDPIVNAIYDDSERMIRAVQARVELARGDVIHDGKVTLNENGLIMEADFGRRGDHQLTEAAFWTSASTTILTYLLQHVQDYVDHNGVMPDHILMAQQRLANFALNTEMRTYASINGNTPSRINMATVADILAAEGLPPIKTYDTQVRVNGVRTRVLPANMVYLMPPPSEPLGNTFYGITAEAIELASRGYIDQTAMPGIVAVVLKNDHPVQTITNGVGIAMPAMPNPDLIMAIQVAA